MYFEGREVMGNSQPSDHETELCVETFKIYLFIVSETVFQWNNVRCFMVAHGQGSECLRNSLCMC